MLPACAAPKKQWLCDFKASKDPTEVFTIFTDEVHNWQKLTKTDQKNWQKIKKTYFNH